MKVNELEKKGFLKLEGISEIKFNITEYQLKNENFEAKWVNRKFEPNELDLNETNYGEIRLTKDNARFSVYTENSLEHFLFVLEQIKKGELNLDYIHSLWKEYKEEHRKVNDLGMKEM